MLRARDASVAARTELINTTRGLRSSRIFAHKGGEAVPAEMREALVPLVRLAATLKWWWKSHSAWVQEVISMICPVEKGLHLPVSRPLRWLPSPSSRVCCRSFQWPAALHCHAFALPSVQRR